MTVDSMRLPAESKDTCALHLHTLSLDCSPDSHRRGTNLNCYHIISRIIVTGSRSLTTASSQCCLTEKHETREASLMLRVIRNAYLTPFTREGTVKLIQIKYNTKYWLCMMQVKSLKKKYNWKNRKIVHTYKLILFA